MFIALWNGLPALLYHHIIFISVASNGLKMTISVTTYCPTKVFIVTGLHTHTHAQTIALVWLGRRCGFLFSTVLYQGCNRVALWNNYRWCYCVPFEHSAMLMHTSSDNSAICCRLHEECAHIRVLNVRCHQLILTSGNIHITTVLFCCWTCCFESQDGKVELK